MIEIEEQHNWDDPFAKTQGTSKNPTSFEEAKLEVLNVIHPMNYWDGCPINGIYDNIKNKRITSPASYLIIPNKYEIGESNLITQKSNDYPKAQMACLNLGDYQSICVQRNIDNMSGYLISLCASGKVEEADKILPGFSKEYKDKLHYTSDNHPVKLENKTYEQINSDVRKNFKTIFPDFLKQTEAQWLKDREKMMIAPDYHVEISNTAYYSIANHKSLYYMPSPENDIITSQCRQANDSIVREMHLQNSKTKQAMLSSIRQKLANHNSNRLNETSVVIGSDINKLRGIGINNTPHQQTHNVFTGKENELAILKMKMDKQYPNI